MTPRTGIHSTAITLAALYLTACSGGGGTGLGPTPTHTIGGTLSGLAAGQQRDAALLHHPEVMPGI